MKRSLLALLAAALAVGCGDDNDEAPEPQPLLTAPSTSELRKARQQFNTVCSATENAIERAERQEFPGDDAPTAAGLQRFVEEVEVPARRGAIESMRRIEVPPSASEAVAAYVDAYERAVMELGADLAVIRDRSVRTEALLNPRLLADRAGLARCGTGALLEDIPPKPDREISSGLDPGS